MQIKFLLSCLAFLIASNFIFAQTKAKFGKISQDELKMEKYDKDPEADAVILQSSCKMSFDVKGNNSYYMVYEVQYRFKVFRQTDAKIADFELPFVGEDESVKVKGSSYNLVNGKIVETELSEKNIFTQAVNNKYSQKKFTMPAVKDGTVFEFQYTFRSKAWYYPQTWYFQESVPVLYSELILEQPDFLMYKTMFSGVNNRITETRYEFKETFQFQYNNAPDAGLFDNGANANRGKETIDCVRFSWLTTDLPAIRPESFMTATRDYTSKMDFLLTHTKFGALPEPFNNSWNELNKRYIEDKTFGGLLSTNEIFNAFVEKVKPIQDPLQKLEAIRKIVNTNVKFNGKYQEFANHNFKKVLETKSGNVAEINLMLCAIAKMSGLEVYPALLSTRSQGKLNVQFPQADLINYVICVMKTPKGLIYADALDANTPVGFLPIECFNDKAWIVNENGGEWMPLPVGKSNETIMYNLNIKANGESSMDAKFGYAGYSAIAFSANKEAHSKSIKENVEKSLGDKKVEIVKELQISPTEAGLQAEISCKAKEEMADIIYIPVLEALGYQKNPFALENRTFSVDMPYLINQTIIANITIPDEYVFDEIPPSKIFLLGDKDGKFTYMSSVNGNTLQLMSKLVLNKNYFTTEEYSFLRNFFGDIVKKHAEQVVLKKK